MENLIGSVVIEIEFRYRQKNLLLYQIDWAPSIYGRVIKREIWGSIKAKTISGPILSFPKQEDFIQFRSF